jgi:acetyl esterase/lipase
MANTMWREAMSSRPMNEVISMASSESLTIRRTIVRDCVREGVSIEEERRQWEAYAATLELKKGIRLRPETISDVPCLWVEDESNPHARVALYIHGGGLIAGSPRTHSEFASRLVERIQRSVLLVDYRLAPEHPFPAALDDVRAVYGGLVARMPAEEILIGAESSGAGLGLAALVKLRDEGRPLPAAAFFISGHFDMTSSGDSMHSRSEVDPFTSQQSLERASRWYANGADPELPLISPVFADLGMLPPILLQVGDDEILLSDSVRVAERVRQFGGRAELRVWDGMWHNWPMYRGFPEADEALVELGEFLEGVSPPP